MDDLRLHANHALKIKYTYIYQGISGHCTQLLKNMSTIHVIKTRCIQCMTKCFTNGIFALKYLWLAVLILVFVFFSKFMILTVLFNDCLTRKINVYYQIF